MSGFSISEKLLGNRQPELKRQQKRFLTGYDNKMWVYLGCVVLEFSQRIRVGGGVSDESRGKLGEKREILTSDKLAGELVGMDPFDTRAALACMGHENLS